MVDFQCLSSGAPACRLLSSKPFDEIVLKFLSAKSPSILVPLTPSAFFTVTTDSPSVLCFFLTLLIELPGFYIRLLNDTPFFELHAAKCHCAQHRHSTQYTL